MKKLSLISLFTVFTVFFLFSQKYAYVDTEYILDNIPEYIDAQNQLDELAEDFQREIEAKYEDIDRMYKAFQAEVVLMPEDVRERREEELMAMKLEVKELQTQRFGIDGDLFLKREELVKPIQEKIFNSIEEIATEKNYAFVFDKAGSLTILYVNAKYDISDNVLDDVGAELGTIRKEDRKRNEYNSSSGTSKPANSNSPPKNSRTSPGPVQKSDRK
ncbi:MAG: OmpH family outer membrane protein [Bacteroidales bacterium]|nr:OmpH family outer membrane protein [Bacteroidales bacterium]